MRKRITTIWRFSSDGRRDKIIRGGKMELYQLRYFLYAAKYENISKAAQELRVAQPSVSKAIFALEKELQVKLFERNGKRVELTYAGRVLKEKVSPVMWSLDELPGEMRQLGTEMEIIHLNAVSAVPLLADIIKTFKEKEPNVMFLVTDQREKTDWDICICSSSPDMAFNQGTELMKEKVFLGVSKECWLRDYDKISLKELKDEEFILLPHGTILRNLADVRFREHQFLPKVTTECESIHLVWQLVKEGVGITLWPEHSWGMRTDVHFVEIEETGFWRSIFLLRPRNGEISQMSEKFAEYVESYMKNIT